MHLTLLNSCSSSSFMLHGSGPEGFIPLPSFNEGPLEMEDEIAAAYEELYGLAFSGVSIWGNDIYVMDSKMRKISGFGSKVKKEKVRNITKVVKGGNQLHFRAIVVVGDKQGQVGVGKSAVNARRNIITVPMTKYSTFPHRYGKVLILVIAGGAVRIVLEMAGVEIALGKKKLEVKMLSTMPGLL
ncbi:hypothetical protein UlMin_021372 [Ulmus minor]